MFFKEGVSQEIKLKKGTSVKTARIDNAKLKSTLSKIGLTDSSLKVALPKFNKKDTLKLLSNGKKIKQPDMSNLFRIQVPKGKKRKELIDYLNDLPEVLYAEANGTVAPCIVPNDSRYSEQWGLNNPANPNADIHAEAAWDIYTGNSNNIIAIIDGGTDVNHPDLNDKISGGDSGYGWRGNGIHVSGIAAAESNNNQGVSGVDWNARLHNQRIDNVQDDADTYQAIVDAVNYSENVHVLNNSWGLTNDDESPGRSSTIVRQAIAYAYKANRVFVAAMGNHQLTHPDVVHYPAGYDNVISVGATNNGNGLADFSVHGNNINVCAPGVNILSTDVNGGYGYRSGTSMATPFVSGLASLLKGYNPNLENDDIKNIIELSADDLGVPSYDTQFGHGRINAERALNYLRAPYTLAQWSAKGGTVVNSTSRYSMIMMGVLGLASGTYLVKRHEVQKDVQFPQGFCSLVGAWGRGVSTSGFNVLNPNFGEGFCEVVQGTLTDTGVSLRTYVYEIWSITGAYIGYYPTSPSNVNFAYTTLGVLSPTLSGPDLLCTGATTYTLNNLPSGTTVSWTSSSNITFPSGNTGSSVSAKAGSSTVSGTGWIEATINGTCGDITLPRKEVWVGRPLFILLGESQPLYPRSLTTTTVEYLQVDDPYDQGVTNMEWSYTGPLASINGNLLKADYRTSNSAGEGFVYANASNVCGSKENRIYYEVMDFMRMSVTPNPANEYTELNFYSSGELSDYQMDSKAMYSVPVNKETNNLGEYEVQIWHERYGLVKRVKSRSRKLQIPTNNLEEGIYFLHVIVNGKVHKQQLKIQR
ncbi:S8 family peptidase [Marinifilum sp. D737]|uniref:S8 family peptidase n=1 Tax=Marinifilum sp. D737 TaxID=2969628 RepID=UPI00227592D5|nr:S8 family serine peptidase [Marinifilum sp. D737]MCY1633075.1 S8 family serine peptidase [Marinifilum sp. D737]